MICSLPWLHRTTAELYHNDQGGALMLCKLARNGGSSDKDGYIECVSNVQNFPH
jgi:hypothetical protein